MWFASSAPPPTTGADLPPNTNVANVEVAQGEINPMGARPAQPKLATGLKLAADQEAAMVQRALDRIDELKEEMGLQDGGATVANSWMWEREKNQLQYDNDWAWRAALGGIFKHSNFSLNLSKRYARLMAAKATDDLIGTEPFFAAMPLKHGDPLFAKQSEWYLQEEVAGSNAKMSIADGQKIALIRNEAVVKISHVVTTSKFSGPATVAVGPYMFEGPAGKVYTAPGDPVVTPKGEYIYKKDDIIPDQTVDGLLRLQKEPNVSFRDPAKGGPPMIFASFPDLQQTLRGYKGLYVAVCDYRDFLCPLSVANIHDADICVHLYDDQHERLVATYGLFEVSSNYASQPYLSGERAPKEGKGEHETTSKVLNIVNVADCYMRMDVDGDGIEEEIWLLLDVKAKKAIWYDFLGNHMPKRPFEVIPGVERVPNRWYGVGVFEMLAHKQLYVDTQFNRVNFKSSKSSSVRFRNKNAVAQWKAGQRLVIGDDQIFDVEDPRFDSKNPPLYQVNLSEVDEHAMHLIELMIQAGSTEVGIVGPDDGAMAGLETTKLAAGIKSLERTGNVLMKFTEQDHGRAITDILDQCVNVVLEHMDEDELIFHEDSQTLVALNRDEMRKIKKNVRLLLTRSRSTETIETARMVIQLCREYYEALNPFQQYKLRDEYIRQLKALETPDADTLLDEVSEEAARQWLEQSKQPPTIPPKTSIATKYPDLARSEQIQVLQREGIQPASDQEIAAASAQEKKDEIDLETEKAGAVAAAKAESAPKNGSGSKSNGSKAAR